MLAAWAVCGMAQADVVVAQVSPRTGPLSPNGIGNFIGAKAVFDEVNAQGGIHGQKIRFVFEDDQYAPAETVRLLQRVAERDKPVLFLNLLGSANVTAVIQDKTLERLAIPAVGITPGSEALRASGNPWLFHIQAGDKLQLQKIITHLSTIGVTSISVAYQDIPFGQSGLRFLEEFASRAGVKLLGKVAIKPGSEDLRDAAAQLKASGAQTYIMVLVPNSGASLVRDVRGAGDITPIYGMSYISVSEVIAKAGTMQAIGVALAQITPNTYSDSSGLVRQFKDVMHRFGPKENSPDQFQLIGYAAARVAVEALRRAGPQPNPAKLLATLKTLKLDDGGFPIDFTNGNVGSTYVNIGVIGKSGRLTY